MVERIAIGIASMLLDEQERQLFDLWEPLVRFGRRELARRRVETQGACGVDEAIALDSLGHEWCRRRGVGGGGGCSRHICDG